MTISQPYFHLTLTAYRLSIRYKEFTSAYLYARRFTVLPQIEMSIWGNFSPLPIKFNFKYLFAVRFCLEMMTVNFIPQIQLNFETSNFEFNDPIIDPISKRTKWGQRNFFILITHVQLQLENKTFKTQGLFISV